MIIHSENILQDRHVPSLTPLFNGRPCTMLINTYTFLRPQSKSYVCTRIVDKNYNINNKILEYSIMLMTAHGEKLECRWLKK